MPTSVSTQDVGLAEYLAHPSFPGELALSGDPQHTWLFPVADSTFRLAAPTLLAPPTSMLETVLQDPLLDHIQAIQEGRGDDFWSFKNTAKRRGAHALIH